VIRRFALALGGLVLGFAQPVFAAPRLVVLTDIGNEPDDQMSLVRLLLYSNEIDIEAIIATTSVWQRSKVSPEIAQHVIAAYGQVQPNLKLHASNWPEAADLQARVMSGVGGYGLAAMHPDAPSPGALRLLELARQDSAEPLWVTAWGGTNTLAEALEHARRTFSAGEVERIVGRLRIYAISDQDDAGPWLRKEFPGLFYVVSPSSQDSGDYARSTWTGIAGDEYYRNGAGADFTTVSNEWLDRNIRAKGPLGAAYPRHMFIMEGDTPSFLGLIPNGLNEPVKPNWGGWGGRYLLRQPAGEPRAIWTQGGDAFRRVTSADAVNGVVSDQATIWRWREAFQHDFAARMDWTVQPYAKANHAPQIAIAGSPADDAPLMISLKQGQSLTLDASASRDPDGNRLGYNWFAYSEAGYGPDATMADVALTHANQPRVTITATATCRKAWLDGLVPCRAPGIAHVVLAVSDNGQPSLTRYRRVIVEVRDK
jgi:hypothetical protein